MFYQIFKSIVKFSLKWYVSEWQLKSIDKTKSPNPSIIVSNHPNSFFDALVLAVYHDQEIRFLARGDAFKKPLLNWLLRTFFMLPIFKRMENNSHEIRNAFTYDECIQALKRGEHILIFPEGVSRNVYGLQRFMPSGISSIMKKAIINDLPLQIQAYTIAYNSFNDLPKAVQLQALEPIDCTDYIVAGELDTKAVLKELKTRLGAEVPHTSIQPFSDSQGSKNWMDTAAKLGRYSHQWYFSIINNWVKKKTDGTIFYDSLMFAVLFISYPITIFIISFIISLLLGFWIGLLIFILLPFLSYCWVQTAKLKVREQPSERRKNSLN